MPVILATWEAEIGRMVLPGQWGQKLHRTLSQPIARYSGTSLSFQTTRKAEFGRITVPGQPEQVHKTPS
jgi:hypothetical protein